eukprot:1388104-Pleurochrysis_carterae.AAC.1
MVQQDLSGSERRSAPLFRIASASLISSTALCAAKERAGTRERRTRRGGEGKKKEGGEWGGSVNQKDRRDEDKKNRNAANRESRVPKKRQNGEEEHDDQSETEDGRPRGDGKVGRYAGVDGQDDGSGEKSGATGSKHVAQGREGDKELPRKEGKGETRHDWTRKRPGTASRATPEKEEAVESDGSTHTKVRASRKPQRALP